jgi:hypothetical protein
MALKSQFREHGCENFQPQIFLVAQSICSSLYDTYLVVESLNEAERDLIFWLAVSGDSIPMTLYHFSEFLVRLQALPFQAGLPVIEEAPRPSFPLVAPQLAERFLQQVGGIEALVGRQKRLQGLPAIQRQVLVAAQQDILLALDVAPLRACKPGVFALSHCVERLTQMTHDVELVQQDGRLGRFIVRRVAKRLPHVHHRQTDATGLLLAQPIIELVHAGLRAILAAKPDRSAPDQVADDDAVGVTLSDRDFVDADGLGARRTRFLQLGGHVLLVQFLDGVPVQMQFFGDILDAARATAAPDIPGKPLGAERIVGQEVELLPPHLAATPAENPPNLDFEVDPRVAARQIAHSTCRAVVPTRVRSTAFLADCFFERRTRVMTRAIGSPKMPCTSSCGRKPANRYASKRRLCLSKVAIAKSYQFPQPYQSAETRI